MALKEEELARFRIKNQTFFKLAISKTEDELNEKKKLKKTDDRLTSTEGMFNETELIGKKF